MVTLSFPTAFADAYEIVQQKGVDPRVDYKSLEKYGAWDDRNYELKKEDIDLLDEAFRKGSETAGPLPAWFRVKLRRESALPADRKIEYRNYLNIFLNQEGGWLIEGKYYRGTKVRGDQHKVITGESPR
jgi:hypothetical protein